MSQPNTAAGSGQGRFAGQVVVITGGAGGLGRAAGVRFATEGASVVLVDLPGAALDEAAGEVARVGGPVLPVAADVARWPEVERYAAEAARQFGGIDVLFNNAGVEGYVGSMLDYPEADFDRLMAVNVKGVWFGIKAVVPYLRVRGGGAIINTSSTAGLRSAAAIFAYGASKHAVLGITRSAAREFARDGIRVNAVCPGPIETRMMRALESGINPNDPDAVKRSMNALNPLGRYGEPAEVAALVAFLASADAAYITGGIYTIDGGRTT